MRNRLPKTTGGPGRRWPLVIFLVTFLIYAALTPRLLRYTQPPSGDQPYYLQTAISLVEDHDLNEYNNYHQRASYNQFSPPFGVNYPQNWVGVLAPYPLPPNTHIGATTNRPTTEWYSKHGVGVPILILPGWVIGKALTPLLSNLTLSGNGGWPGTVYEFNMLGALLAVQVFLLAWETTGRRWITLAVWGALAFTNPQMTYSYLIFPELPAALMILYAFRRLRLGWAANGPWRRALVGLCIGYLPWLHSRLLPIVLVLVAFAIYQWWRKPYPWAGCTLKVRWRALRELLVLLAPIALSGAAVAAYYGWLYGTPLPNVQDHAGFWRPWDAVERSALLLSALALFLDQQFGLLIYAPVYLLGIVGIILMAQAHKWRGELGWLALLVVPYFLVVAEYREWWGGWCPPARYLTVIAPLVTVPLALSLQAARRRLGYKALYDLLAGVSIAIMAACFANLDYRTPTRLPILFNLPDGQGSFFLWMESRLGAGLRPYIPALTPWFMYWNVPVPWRAIWANLGVAGSIVGVSLLLLYRAPDWSGGKRVRSLKPILHHGRRRLSWLLNRLISSSRSWPARPKGFRKSLHY